MEKFWKHLITRGVQPYWTPEHQRLYTSFLSEGLKFAYQQAQNIIKKFFIGRGRLHYNPLIQQQSMLYYIIIHNFNPSPLVLVPSCPPGLFFKSNTPTESISIIYYNLYSRSFNFRYRLIPHPALLYPASQTLRVIKFFSKDNQISLSLSYALEKDKR